MALKLERDHINLNLTHVSAIFKIMMMLSTEELNYDKTTIFPSLNVIHGKTPP